MQVAAFEHIDMVTSAWATPGEGPEIRQEVRRRMQAGARRLVPSDLPRNTPVITALGAPRSAVFRNKDAADIERVVTWGDYLETDWVRNLRAAGGGELEYSRRRTQRFTAVEVSDEEKPRVIAAYLDRWGNQVRSQFEALPDPADHPVFRIRPGEA
jgi:hypothetical protein